MVCRLVGRRIQPAQYENLKLGDLLRDDQIAKVAQVSTPLDSLFHNLGIAADSHPLFGAPIGCQERLQKKDK